MNLVSSVVGTETNEPPGIRPECRGQRTVAQTQNQALASLDRSETVAWEGKAELVRLGVPRSYRCRRPRHGRLLLNLARNVARSGLYARIHGL